LAPNATYPANFQETHHAPILSQAQALHGACAGPDRHYLFAEVLALIGIIYLLSFGGAGSFDLGQGG